MARVRRKCWRGKLLTTATVIVVANSHLNAISVLARQWRGNRDALEKWFPFAAKGCVKPLQTLLPLHTCTVRAHEPRYDERIELQMAIDGGSGAICVRQRDCLLCGRKFTWLLQVGTYFSKLTHIHKHLARVSNAMQPSFGSEANNQQVATIYLHSSQLLLCCWNGTSQTLLNGKRVLRKLEGMNRATMLR